MRWSAFLARNVRPVVAVVLLLATAVVLVSVPSQGSAAPYPGPRQVTILPPGELYYGKTYNELAGDWWNWALQFPSEVNPLLDTTGEFGALGQEGRVWFLAGNFGGENVRELRVPPDKAVLVPMFNSLWWSPEDGNLEEVRALANAQVNSGADVWCTINGKLVEDVYAYRAQSQPGGFPFAIVEGGLLNEWGYEPRDAEPAVADGYWLLLEPLPIGRHTIVFHSSIPSMDWELQVTYYLTVVLPK
ncbi:MAG TPA: hypothetical protein DCM87_05525 [Planctomycetes bacterium]|nr:hypothetical protein [Planctomycetota bacterium]